MINLKKNRAQQCLVNTFKTTEFAFTQTQTFELDVLQLILRDLFIILSQFLAGSCSVKMSQAFLDPSIDFHHTWKRQFKTPEMHLYFHLDVCGGCLALRTSVRDIFRSSYSYSTRTATCICYSYGSRKISMDFSVIADSCLSKLLYYIYLQKD